MLHVKLSIHILQGILLPIYSILNGIFAICSHFIRIYVHTLERQLHAIYIFTHIYIHSKSNFMLHIHWKSNFCTTYSYFLKTISYHMFLFGEAFLCHTQHIYTFAKHLATYSIYTLSQPTLRREGDARLARCVFQERNTRGVATNVYLRKMSEKPEKTRSTNF